MGMGGGCEPHRRAWGKQNPAGPVQAERWVGGNDACKLARVRAALAYCAPDECEVRAARPVTARQRQCRQRNIVSIIIPAGRGSRVRLPSRAPNNVAKRTHNVCCLS